jgi:hypothetical protein
VNRTEYFIALASLGIIFDVSNPQGTEAFAFIGGIATLFVFWINEVRKDNAALVDD